MLTYNLGISYNKAALKNLAKRGKYTAISCCSHSTQNTWKFFQIHDGTIFFKMHEWLVIGKLDRTLIVADCADFLAQYYPDTNKQTLEWTNH